MYVDNTTNLTLGTYDGNFGFSNSSFENGNDNYYNVVQMESSCTIGVQHP